MTELMPAIEAEMIHKSLESYLTTTFALTDDTTSANLGEFLSNPENGIFKGPYVRTRLPFLASADSESALEWTTSLKPYGHQSEAFERLASVRDGREVRPLPTLVTTGTGSGKTEAFLYPILDHVLRAKRAGKPGVKALILYPMNALANDQAQRLAELITSDPRLAGVSAAIYTGDQESQRSTVSREGLITSRYAIRETPPDILLTNYKMLDLLLLRADDQVLWRTSADSLQYLVLDEFHTYSGAQGTDVAMLLRRLGMTLRHYQDSEALTPEERERPLGRVTPVATSATMGGDGSGEGLDEATADLRAFAETVFGEAFGPDAVIGETRQTLAQWVGDAGAEVAALGIELRDLIDVDELAYAEGLKALGDRPEPEDLMRLTLEQIVAGFGDGRLLEDVLSDVALQGLVFRASPIVQQLVAASTRSVALADLPELFLPPWKKQGRSWIHQSENWQAFFRGLISAIGHLRAEIGRSFVSVEVHYWVRELSRIDRAAESTPTFSWTDDGAVDAGGGVVTAGGLEAAEQRPRFPAIYCRHCGRSGWLVRMNPVGDDHQQGDAAIRRDKEKGRARVRSVIYAPTEGEAALAQNLSIEGLAWWDIRNLHFDSALTSEDEEGRLDGWVLPVLINTGREGDEEDREDTCPACGQRDSIRYLGSRIPTLLSVSLSSLFGAKGLDNQEKRALVFTDSVQDAAHRAGFVQARAHAMTMRSILAEGMTDEEMNLEDLVNNIMAQAGNDPIRRYRLLPPEIADRETFKPYWDPAGTTDASRRRARNRVKDRLLFQATLEFGTQAYIGRTLELTGTASAYVEAGESPLLDSLARRALEGSAWLDTAASGEGKAARQTRISWVRGVLEHIRTSGGIDHKWLHKYIADDGARYFIWGGRNRADGMPAFPKGRRAPAFPTVGGAGSASGSAAGSADKKGELHPVLTPTSWYSVWTGKQLGVPAYGAGQAAAVLLRLLGEEGLLTVHRTKSGATVYAVPSSSVIVRIATLKELHGGQIMLECDICAALVPGSVGSVDQLDGAPCMSGRCAGHLRRKEMGAGFYRELYLSSSSRRLVAREHTGLLDNKVRMEYEDAFKTAATDPSAPNVLVATPTLEMGIDIGDLSAVYLSSLPRTVASYTQRVGRAGRLNGSALAVTYARGRRATLQKVLNPQSVIDGPVAAPNTYLDALEILKRQYLAAVMDSFARDPNRPHPRTVTQVLGSTGEKSFLGEVIEVAEEKGLLLTEFAENLKGVDQESLDKLDQWVSAPNGKGSSQLAADVSRAAQRWRYELDQLEFRIKALNELLPDLEAEAEAPTATEESQRELRAAQAALKLSRGRQATLKGKYWISALEEFGLLPNYTLLGDATLLGVGVSETNPETGERETESLSVSRDSAQALYEFAPGATFFTQGLEVQVDAVDLGVQADAIEEWVLCADCGYGKNLTEEGGKAPLACPRCGSASIADIGQKYSLVEFQRATAEVVRDESTISDYRDDRPPNPFDVVTEFDLDPERRSVLWGESGSRLGCAFYESMTVRYVNLGRAGSGRTAKIAGVQGEKSLFALCPGCGTDQSKATSPGRHGFLHRPWCKYRKAQASPQVEVALTHTLSTQGLVLYLPLTVTEADSYAVPSLIAALQLGFSEVLGGDPEHLSFTVAWVPDPSGHGTREALVVHDQMPGGTGYITDWAQAENLHRILAAAWEVVANCSCATEERIACEACLLPYAWGASTDRVSRAAAERHLGTLLGLAADDAGAKPDIAQWEVTVGEVATADPGESPLEHRFRKAVASRLENMGAQITEKVEREYTTLTIVLPGAARQWSLKPQVPLGYTKPDFLLESSDPNIPPVAIYTDGYAYHASATSKRVAMDADQREWLRQGGGGRPMGVLAVTDQDLDELDRGENTEPILSAEKRRQLVDAGPCQSTPNAYQRQGINPVEWLVQWIENPDFEHIKVAARGVPTGFRMRKVASYEGESVTEAGVRELTGHEGAGAS